MRTEEDAKDEKAEYIMKGEKDKKFCLKAEMNEKVVMCTHKCLSSSLFSNQNVFPIKTNFEQWKPTEQTILLNKRFYWTII